MMSVPAVLSGAGAISGMFGGGGAGDVQRPDMFQMPDMYGAAHNAYTNITDMMGNNTAARLQPQYQSVVDKMMANPGTAGAQSGANTAAEYGGIAGLNALQGGQQMVNAGGKLQGYVDPIMQSAFDPRSALYARTAQQTQDQTRAGLEARGVNSSPYGAGIEGQQMSNFNIDWQNAQLARQVAGSGAAQGLTTAGNQGIAGGAALQATAPGTVQSSSMMPYNFYQQAGADQLGGLNTLLGVGNADNAQRQSGIQDWLSYVGAGNQANSVANQNFAGGLAQQQQGFGQNQILGGQLGAAFSGMNNNNGWGALAGLFGGGGGGMGGAGGGGLSAGLGAL